MPKRYEVMTKSELVAEYRRLESVLKKQDFSRPMARGITLTRMSQIQRLLKSKE